MKWEVVGGGRILSSIRNEVADGGRRSGSSRVNEEGQ